MREAMITGEMVELELRRARAGQITGLIALNNHLGVRPGLCTVDVIRDMYSYLSPESIPVPGSERWREICAEKERSPAWWAISVLERLSRGKLGGGLEGHGAVMEALLTGAQEQAEGILLWIHFLSVALPERQRSGFILLSIVRNLLALDKEFHPGDLKLTRTFHYLPSLVDLVFAAWTNKGRTVGEDLLIGAACPVIYVLKSILNTDDGRETVKDRVASEPSIASAIIQWAVRRLEATAAVLTKQVQSESEVQQAARTLGYTGHILDAGQELARIPAMAKALSGSMFFATVSKLMFSVLLAVASSPSSLRPRQKILIQWIRKQVLDIAIASSSFSPLRNWTQLIGGGYVQVLKCLVNSVEGLGFQCRYSGPGNVDVDTLQKAISMLSVHMAHPRLWKATWHQLHVPKFEAMTAALLSGPNIPQPIYVAAWDSLKSRMTSVNPSNLTCSKTGLTCDNYKCQSQSPISKIKKCSRCGRMAYCSVTCQAEDWRELHRSECMVIAINREEFIDVYSWSSRRVSIVRIEEVMKSHEATWIPGTMAHSDFKEMGMKAVFVPLGKVAKVWSSSWALWSQEPCLLPRVKLFQESFARQDPNIRLVEQVLEVGMWSVSNVVAFRRVHAGRRFYPLCSLVYYVRCSSCAAQL
ncbi:hypothetical protein D9611_008148 [Ephemerocybe angulata]|uniref:phytol kinase n=1 Tax=Ephemerocybe angulata TaxID=980116 RepID=A0A8H5FD44_9AGAR|nr:hypothetical protein D9611_008148 [Tulosesus angulatus]